MSECETAAEGRGEVTTVFRKREVVGIDGGDGSLLVEGDIKLPVLTPLQRVAQALIDLRDTGPSEEVLEAIATFEKALFPANGLEGATVADSTKLWRLGIVPYEIHPELPGKKRVTEAIAHWEQHTSLRFVVRTDEKHWIRFVPSDGCASFVGRQTAQPQQIDLGEACTTGNCIHEIGHSIGLWHEQSRLDRDQHVRIDWNNVNPRAIRNFQQVFNDTKDSGPYDFGSIMHYPLVSFALDRNKPTITPIGDTGGARIGQRDGLSPGDIETVNKLYAAEVADRDQGA